MRFPTSRLSRGTLRAALLALAALLAAGHARAEPIAPGAVRVIDGDTIAAQGAHWRLVGFDTPEAGRKARCPAEREMAAAASRRLRQIVAGGGLDLTEVACSCAPGTAGTPRCNFGRRCGVLRAGGRDVGDMLITAGLAVPYPYAWRHPPARQDWCGRGTR